MWSNNETVYFHFENKGMLQGINYISKLNFIKFDRNRKTRTVELCSRQYLGYNFILNFLLEHPYAITKKHSTSLLSTWVSLKYIIRRQCLLFTVLYLVPRCLRSEGATENQSWFLEEYTKFVSFCANLMRKYIGTKTLKKATVLR